jgi:hypothetical protein
MRAHEEERPGSDDVSAANESCVSAGVISVMSLSLFACKLWDDVGENP